MQAIIPFMAILASASLPYSPIMANLAVSVGGALVTRAMRPPISAQLENNSTLCLNGSFSHTREMILGANDGRVNRRCGRSGRLLGRGVGETAAQPLIDCALQEIIGRAAHDSSCDELRQERRSAEYARNCRLQSGIKTSRHDHRDHRPGYVRAHQDDRAQREAPADLFGGELWFGGSYGNLLQDPSA